MVEKTHSDYYIYNRESSKNCGGMYLGIAVVFVIVLIALVLLSVMFGKSFSQSALGADSEVRGCGCGCRNSQGCC